MKNIFKDLRVLELANVLAGPATGMFFAELGATVTKIENARTGGDITRKWKLPSEDKNSNTSAYYLSANYGKKTVFLDLKNPAHLKKVHTLIKNSDIIISNFKKGADKKLKLDFTTAKKINPKIIYAHLSGYGEKSSRTAFDLVLQAETGFMSMNGTRNSGPVKMPVALIDIIAAHHLKEAILIALLKRSKTKKGSYVSVSLYDAAIASLANQAANYLIANKIPERIGSLHPNIAPYGEIFRSKDKKQFVLAIGTEKQFSNLCHTFDLKHLLRDKKYSSNQQRVIYRQSLEKILSKTFKSYTSKQLVHKFNATDVPAGRILNLKEVFAEKASNRLLINLGKAYKHRAIARSVIFDIWS